jgi:hypothetical protein
MVVQNNNSHWVILAAIGLCLAMAFGAVLMGALGTSQDVKDEQARIINQATEAALHAIETPQAIFAGQTAVAAELTAMPPAQTATAIALSEKHLLVQQAATQTAIANDNYMNGLAAAATTTALAQSQKNQNTTAVTRTSLAILGVVTLCVWILARVAINILTANTQYKLAQAGVLERQQKLAEFRVAHQKTGRPVVLPSVPISPVKERGNGHKLPHAE